MFQREENAGGETSSTEIERAAVQVSLRPCRKRGEGCYLYATFSGTQTEDFANARMRRQAHRRLWGGVGNSLQLLANIGIIG